MHIYLQISSSSIFLSKKEMQAQQRRFLNVIGISTRRALPVHNIKPMEDFLNEQCVNIVQRILDQLRIPEPSHHDQHPSQQIQQQRHRAANQHHTVPKLGLAEEPPHHSRCVRQ
jgi:hypothetical protein